MKTLILASIFFFTPMCFVLGQGEFDKSIAEISADLAGKLNQKGKKKLVVLYITDVSRTPATMGKYIADAISVNIVNDTSDFQVFDRENLNSIADAKKLISEGYIDVDKTKELGKLLAVDVIVVGNYTVLATEINLTAKALDATTGFIIAAATKKLPLDSDAGALLGINIQGNTNGASASNRGFNDIPINSNERYNNPNTVDRSCEAKNTGDFCFTNSTKDKFCIKIVLPGNGVSTFVNPGETKCFYNISSSNYKYYIVGEPGKKYPMDIVMHDSPCSGYLYDTGEINIEKCKSKTFIVR